MAENPGHLVISEEDKNTLMEEMHELEFLDAKSLLQQYCCYICGCIAIRHCISNCRKVFCRGCYFRFYRQPCPACRTIVNGNPDDNFERAVFQLRVACRYKDDGCQEILTLGTYLKDDYIDEIKNGAKAKGV